MLPKEAEQSTCQRLLERHGNSSDIEFIQNARRRVRAHLFR